MARGRARLCRSTSGTRSSPEEFLLADEHLGARAAVHRYPSLRSVSTYLLAGRDEQRNDSLDQLVPRDQPMALLRMPRRSSLRAPA